MDNARAKKSLKRGGLLEREPLQDMASREASASQTEILAIHEALERFAREDPQKAELVKLRYFAGLTLPEIADILGISRATASRHWTYAKAWLFDAVFGEEERKSGLWAEVGLDRMRARGLDEQQLQDYYRNRNLLKSRVTARHVANAVLFFATRQTPTTGATIPVDGGLPDSTPR